MKMSRFSIRISFVIALTIATVISSGCTLVSEMARGGGFRPYGYSFHWNSAVVSWMVLANLGIATAYFAIPAALWYFVRHRKDIPYPWVFWLLGMSIIAGGVTHLMKVWTVYQPLYWTEIFVDGFTAIVSLLTALLLWPLIPKALALKSPKDLEEANQKLQQALVRDQQAHAALQEQAKLFDLTHDTILVRDLDGTIRYWNHGAEEMYGYTKAEAIGQSSHDLFKTRFPIPLEQIEKDILVKGRWNGEVVHHVRDGRKIIVSSRQALKTDAQGKPVAVLEINSDITELKLAERRQQKMTEMKRSNVELEQFAYIASHDLQEPLRAVAGGLQILQKTYKDKLDNNANELIELAVDGAARMRTLISDILSLSRISSADVTFERVDISMFLEQALRNMTVTVKETGAKITHDALPVLTVERTQLTQLFQNLISNALKFRSDKSPEIHIGVVHQENEWQFAVRDNGIGFEAEHSEKIFEPFKRLHGRDKYPGTGIGLAICKRIVERHGGRIWVESKPGEGTTFYFTIADVEQA